MHTRYLDAVKTFEGFAKQSSWDYAQHTNGFGTKALYPGEQISPEEANRRFTIEIDEARRFVEKQASGWDEGTKAALTSLTFNAGTRWASSGLGDAVRNFDIDAVRSQFLQYTKAGGEVLPGLVKRRLSEVTWIGENFSATTEHATKLSWTSSRSAVAHVADSNAAGTRPDEPSAKRVKTEETGIVRDRNFSDKSSPVESAATEQASSVAWMLLALDFGAFGPRPSKDRDNEVPVTA
ncbi:MAG: lysozyme [Hyphomicrobiaceae bacterium]